MYATLEFASDLYKTMENIKISVDGANVAITEDKNNAKVTFEVNSVDSKIGVSSYITAMGMNINYTVGLETSTIEKISSSSNGVLLCDNFIFILQNIIPGNNNTFFTFLGIHL